MATPTTHRLPNVFCFVYTSASDEQPIHYALLDSVEHIRSSLAFTLAQPYGYSVRLACVRNAWKRSAKPIVEFNEGCLWATSINPHESVFFVLLTAIVAICMLVVRMPKTTNQITVLLHRYDLIWFKNIIKSIEFKSLFCGSVRVKFNLMTHFLCRKL